MQRLATVAVALGALATPLWFLTVDDPTFDRYELPKEGWLSLAAAVATLSGLGPARLRRLDLMALGFALVSVLAMTTARSPALAMRHVGVTLGATGLFLAARRLDARGREMARTGALAGAMVVAAIALGEGLGMITGLSAFGRAPGSTLGQRNAVAHLCLLASPLAMSLAATGARRRWLGVGVGALLLATIVQTRCRAAWLMMPFAVGTWLLFVRVGIRCRLATVAWVVVGVAASAALPSRLAWRSVHPLRDSWATLLDAGHGSGRGRLIQAKASLAMLDGSWILGVGPGHWMVEYPRVRPPRDPTFDPDRAFPIGRLPSSDWLALLVERGALGTAMALVFAAAALYALWLERARMPGRGNSAEIATALSVCVAALGLGTFDAVVHLPAPAALLAVAVGTALPEEHESPAMARRGSRIVAVGLSALLVCALAASVAHLAGLWARSRPDAGFDGLEKAIRLNPADLYARYTLVEALLLEGRCADARPHLEALSRLLPHHPSVRSMSEACPTR